MINNFKYTPTFPFIILCTSAFLQAFPGLQYVFALSYLYRSTEKTLSNPDEHMLFQQMSK